MDHTVPDFVWVWLDNERLVPLRLAQPVCAGAYKSFNLAPTGTGINIRFIYLQDLNPGFKT